MIKFNDIPKCVTDYTEQKGLAQNNIILFAAADRTNDCNFCHIYFIVTKDKFIILSGLLDDEKIHTYTGYRIASDSKNPSVFTPLNYEELNLNEINNFDIINNAAGSTFFANIDGEDRALCGFSASAAKQMNRFLRLLKIVKEGNEITDSDLTDDDFIKYCPKCHRMYPDQSRELCPYHLNKRALILRLFKYIRPYRFAFLTVILLLIVAIAIDLIQPYLMGTVFINDVLNPAGKFYGHVGELVLIIFGMSVLALIIQIINSRINIHMSTEISNDIRVDIFNTLQKLSMSFFSKHHSGSLMTRINDDSVEIQYFFIEVLPNLLVQILNIIVITIILFTINWRLSLIVYLPLPIIVYLSLTSMPKIKKYYERRWATKSSMNSILNDSLKGTRVIKAFGKEKDEIGRFARSSEKVKFSELKIGLFQNTFFPLFELLMAFSLVLIWGFGSLQVLGKALTIGELTTIISYITMIFRPLADLGYTVFRWSNVVNSAQRVFEVLDAVPEITDKEDAVSLDNIKGDINLKNVSFSYVPTKPILTDISVDIKAGQMLGIVGHSGAGKSTLVNLINRLYDVKLGSITIDGVDIRSINSESLKSQIGIVSQETYVFMKSVMENISFAKPDCTREEVIAAAKAANAHDFIMKMPDGYDTVIGTGIRELSGGEKQRLSIARAILHNPRILILDEATSSVDTQTELNVQEALERLAKGRTTISIAHRLSTLRNADYLIVIDHGKLAESGTHLELIKKKGIYYELMQTQMKALALRGVGE